jgi:5-methylthioribose kinase
VTYAVLNATSLEAHLRANAAHLPHWFDASATLETTELSDGNLNAVYRVCSGNSSLLVKQGLPFLRVAGEGWPLSASRAGLEARVLEWQDRLAPGTVPRLYWHDPVMCLNVMEDLRGYAVIRHPMIERAQYNHLGSSIGAFLARVHHGTSDFALEPAAKKALTLEFLNPELCAITEDLIFTEPFEPVLLPPEQNRNNVLETVRPDLERLQANQPVRLAVARLKYRFMTAGEVLLHGDLHTGSIMATVPDVNGNAEIRVIDPEFAFFGPAGFDLGLFLANLLLNATAQRAHAPNETELHAYRAYLESQRRACWDTYSTDWLERMHHVSSASWRNAGFARRVLLETLRDACGFAGCELVRRSVGFAHVADVDSIQDDAKKADVIRQNLTLGSRLILGADKVYTFDDLERIVSDTLEPTGAQR